jgi:hypothetical protein
MAFDVDVLQHDHVIITGDFLKGSVKHLIRVLIIAGKKLLIGFDDTFGRVDQALALGIIAGPGNECPDSIFGSLPCRFSHFFLRWIWFGSSLSAQAVILIHKPARRLIAIIFPANKNKWPPMSAISYRRRNMIEDENTFI